MRLFVAIDIDESIRKALDKLQKQIEAQAGAKSKDVKWVKTDDIHLTLKFLGEVEDEKIKQLCDTVKDVSTMHSKFELEIKSVGCFGGKSARIVWVGVGYGQKELLALQKDIDEELEKQGWPREDREFSGHLTLCRVKNPKAGFKLTEVAENYKNLKLGTIDVDSVSIYSSQLTEEGPIYTLLGNYKLGQQLT